MRRCQEVPCSGHDVEDGIISALIQEAVGSQSGATSDADQPGVTNSMSTPPETDAPKLEIGILVDPDIAIPLLSTIVETLRQELQQRFPDFQWCFEQQRWTRHRSAPIHEPSALLVEAAERRESAHWDFVLVITNAELVGHSRRNTLAVLSRPLDAAIVSTSRLTPPGEDRGEYLLQLVTLLQQGLAHIAGLDAHDSPHNLLYRPEHASDLDLMRILDTTQIERWRTHLRKISDQRLEESQTTFHPARFLFRAMWINQADIIAAILGARPWQLPYRLGRLTAAAISAVALVLMTAEAWEVGLSLTPSRLAILAALSLFSTTLFVTARQKLLPRRVIMDTEQSVVTAVASAAIVCIGMATAWLMLTVLALLVSILVFPADVIAGWAPTALGDLSVVTLTLRIRMATFVASLAAMIGALGASFEDQHYFRHVVLVDEEI